MSSSIAVTPPVRTSVARIDTGILACNSQTVTTAAHLADELADELGMDPGDIRVLLEQMGAEPGAEVGVEYAEAVRDQVDHYCERSVPAFWWPGSDPEAGTGATRMTW
jgi:hypothetical protein